MGKDEIKKLLEDSEKNIKQVSDEFTKTITDDLQKFKKRALEKI